MRPSSEPTKKNAAATNESIRNTPRSPAGQSAPGMEADTPQKFSRGTTPSERGEKSAQRPTAGKAKSKK